jgi:hypothetical protein
LLDGEAVVVLSGWHGLYGLMDMLFTSGFTKRVTSLDELQQYLPQHGAHLQIFIQFDDVNYPGSTCDLIYLPDQGRLTTNYFQAMMGKYFDVVFVRKED